MSVSIKVAVRCRPFTIDDDLGVSLVQNNEEEGEINILNSSYSTTRFAFTYAWWSAFGFPRHVKKNASEAEGMKLIDQQEVYNSIGKRIKTDVLTGNAVVMFAYGLSGSGKTFTVFGPDAVEEPEAWFKHGKPHPLWGIFPRLAYEVFQAKEDGWKITMKYFQNVVDTVRDLMSPVGKEMHYKNGMKKDQDGFTDIEWCCSAVLNSWDDLRKMFKAANARKAIAPTQFNHQSTRGHCIMVLEVETPHPDTAGLKQRGRIYVCDLAGTEPAGDIVYARYEKQVFEGGEIEHRYIGPHNETNKTKELQEQGKKINLSLSEMAQFFMKMAEAIQSRTLKPGHSIPGCNSYFLCKYLKDTMLQARTYLFCAIRPEVTYHKYTFSTLGFAKNASVIKLKPKMATVMATAAEKKLMAELEQMKRLVEQLRKGQGQLVAAPNPKPQTTIPVHAPADHTSEEPKSKAEEPKISKDESAEAAVDPHPEESQESRKRRKSITKNADQVSHIQEMLEAKQMQLREVLSGGIGSDQGPTPEEKELLRQREEYARRGISLSHFEADTRLPHLVNVDEDPFRHNRFVYVLKKRITVFGPQGDVQPMSLSVQRKHCATEVKKGEAGAKGTVILIGGRGDVWHNGKPVRKQEKVVLSQHDRVAIGAELLLFRWKAFDTPETGPPPTAEEAVTEFKRAMKASSGRRRSAELHAMEEQLKTLQEAKAKAEEEARSAIAGKAEIREKEQWTTPFHTQPLDDDHIASVMRSAEDDVQMLLPHVKEMEQFMHLFGREYITFDITLQRSQGEAFEVAASVQVKNERTRQACYISSFEFLEHRSIFQAEVAELQAALDNEREYSVPAEHDPGLRLLQGTHQLGVATLFTEPIVYMMAVEDEEGLSVVKNVRAPYGEVGKLESSWHPLVLDADGRTLDPEEDEDCAIELPEIDTPMDLVGQSWAYRFEIKMASGLPLTCASAYCQYDLLGEAFTTETVQPDPPSTLPVFHYSFVHKVDEVTQDIVQHLCKPLNVYLYVGPHVEPEKPEDNISTKNPRVVERFESLRQPNTPVPTASPSGRPTSPIRSPQLKGNGESSSNIDVGPLSSWGFAAPDVCLEGFEETQGGDTMTVELSRLRTENALLKKELKTAREEIDRLTRGRAGGVMTSASTSVLPDREGLVLDRMNEGKMVEVNGRSHVVNDGTPREIKSRKEIDIDTARLTDAAVEAAIGGAR